ncbi:MAG: HEAT repeat domain-containing protein [Planctomycetia bacterium]|nr:HEAT repeat domain-containing protein [Planctomycetia bacterium]
MQKYIPFLLQILLFCPFAVMAEEKEMSSEMAWNALENYQFGDDWQPLLMITDEVQKATETSESKSLMAQKLAGYLNDKTTYAGRQFVCMQLRLVGTAAEVPVLAKYLQSEEDFENARLALADIICEESLVVLRDALQNEKGQKLAAVIGALADRHDISSMANIAKFCDSDDSAVSQAAVEALGKFGAEAYDLLKNAKLNVSQDVREATFIKIARSLAESGQLDESLKLFNELASKSSKRGTRRAAFQQILAFSDETTKKQLIYDWFFENDEEKNVIAAAHLNELTSSNLDQLYNEYDKMGQDAKLIILEVLAEQKGDEMLQNALKAVKSDDLSLRLTAIRTLGRLGDISVVPVLIEQLNSNDDIQNATREALQTFPKDVLSPMLIEKLPQTDLQQGVISCLAELKCYEAIDPLIQLAKTENGTSFTNAINALTKICDPDSYDIPRLLELYLSSQKGKQRESMERMIVTVCEKNPNAEERVDVIISSLDKREGGLNSALTDILPLLGKLGNKRVYEDFVKPNLTSDQPALQTAAFRAFCNWPNVDYIDDLWLNAQNNNSDVFQQWALRAFIRLVTLKSDRPESETLEMLKNAMNVAKNRDDKRLCLQRTSVVRTIEAVEWISTFLDNPDFVETAANTIVELAHHRFLREPNKEKFQPILLKIEKVSKNAEVVEKAKKARLGM